MEKQGNQASIKFYDNKVIKSYNNKPVNKMSSLDNDLYHLNMFKDNIHCIKFFNPNDSGYEMERLDFSLGNPKKIFEDNVRRMLFTIPESEVLKQLNGIENVLKEKGINHRDINPGNLLFSEKSKIIKLIDFYWTISKGHEVGTPGGLNGFYKDDHSAFNRIKTEISEISKRVNKQIKNTKKVLSHMGKTWYEGSAKRKGKTYHRIDIPYFNNMFFHRNIDSEVKEVLSLITGKVNQVIDIGCAGGFYLFNLIRNYYLKKAIGYEADPIMNQALCNIKKIFALEMLEIKNKIIGDTIFENVNDVAIYMNIHMWIYKQLGKESDIVLSNLIKSSRQIFFQTAGLESNGMFLDKRMKDKETIQDYLLKVGNEKKVEFIRTTKLHGGKRHLFKIGD